MTGSTHHGCSMGRSTARPSYVRNELLKTLKPGDIVVLDNLGSHKGKAVRNMIRNAGAHLMFLPPYSPDLNPIEQVFAKIKHLMRRAMERTVETAQDRLVSVLDTIPPSECANLNARRD
jgi:putative transposase